MIIEVPTADKVGRSSEELGNVPLKYSKYKKCCTEAFTVGKILSVAN